MACNIMYRYIYCLVCIMMVCDIKYPCTCVWNGGKFFFTTINNKFYNLHILSIEIYIYYNMLIKCLCNYVFFQSSNSFPLVYVFIVQYFCWPLRPLIGQLRKLKTIENILHAISFVGMSFSATGLSQPDISWFTETCI